METHSSVLAWRIPGTGEPGGLLPLRLHSRTRLKRLSSSSSDSSFWFQFVFLWQFNDVDHLFMCLFISQLYTLLDKMFQFSPFSNWLV